MTTPLITLSEAKAMLDIRDTNTAHDPLLTSLTTAATSQIETAIRGKLTQAVHTELFDTRRTLRQGFDLHGNSASGLVEWADEQRFHLRGFMVDATAPLTVEYAFNRDFAAVTPVDPRHYVLEAATGLLRLFLATSDAAKALRVTYTAGIAAVDGTLSANAPAELKLAAQVQTTFLFKRLRSENIGHKASAALTGEKSKSAAAYWNVSQGLCHEAMSMVRHLRRPLIPTGG